MKKLLITLTLTLGILAFFYACSDDSESQEGPIIENGVHSFSYNGKTYAIVTINKPWEDAAAFARERGAYLAEINDIAEQTAIYDAVAKHDSVDFSSTTAPDGGGGSYVWLGANDIQTEGQWFWDGNYDGTGTKFWVGEVDGSAVGGLYNNWGNEPDNYAGSQNALGLALTNWPMGSKGQWNDLIENNELYFVMEY